MVNQHVLRLVGPLSENAGENKVVEVLTRRATFLLTSRIVSHAGKPEPIWGERVARGLLEPSGRKLFEA